MYKVLEAGPGDGRTPNGIDYIDVTYSGHLTDGTQFATGTSKLNMAQVIDGWYHPLQKMHEGDHFELYIPHHLAYGKEGSEKVPGGAPVVFQLKLNRILGMS